MSMHFHQLETHIPREIIDLYNIHKDRETRDLPYCFTVVVQLKEFYASLVRIWQACHLSHLMLSSDDGKIFSRLQLISLVLIQDLRNPLLREKIVVWIENRTFTHSYMKEITFKNVNWQRYRQWKDWSFHTISIVLCIDPFTGVQWQ